MRKILIILYLLLFAIPAYPATVIDGQVQTGGGAPTNAHYLTDQAESDLSAEVVVSTVGKNLATLTNPSAITFPRINANNTVTALNASDFLTAIGGQASLTGATPSITLGVTGSTLTFDLSAGTDPGFVFGDGTIGLKSGTSFQTGTLTLVNGSIFGQTGTTATDSFCFAGYDTGATAYHCLLTLYAHATHPYMEVGPASNNMKIDDDGIATPQGTFYLGTMPITFDEILAPAGGALSAANVDRTFVNNDGQTNDATSTFPTIGEGKSVVFFVGTQVNKYWKVQRANSTTIIFENAGTITTGKTYFTETNQEVGSRVSCASVTVSGTLTWFCSAIHGIWTTD
jgi:hypothetical protein